MFCRPAGVLPTQHPNSLQTVVRDQVHSKTRVRWPMVRKGFLASPDKPQGIRGQDEFVRVSWDDALALIHAQHRRIRDTYGPSSIFAGSYGWRSNGVLHKASTLLQRYMSLAGGYTGHLGDYSTGAAQAIMPYVVGGNEVYQQQTSWPLVLAHTDVVVLWSANPLNTLKIAWNASDEQGIGYFDALRKSGKRIICIDPMRSETMDFFGDSAEWIAPHMGTDVAMMLGIAHTLVENGWHDVEFLTRCTTGFDKFADYLTGQSDGVAKTAEWAADICGVPAEKIRELAALFHKNTTMLMSGWGMQRQQFGEQKHWMLVTLAAMLGQIGTPGGGFGLSYHFANGGNPTRKAAVLASLQGSVQGGVDAVDKIPVARIVEALENPGGFYQHNGLDRHFPDIKFVCELWEAGGRERFTEGKSDLQWLESFYQIAGQRGAAQGVTLPPFAEFWEANQIVEMPESEQNAKFVRFADFRRDPESHPLKTESGKIVIHSERIASFGYADCPPHPMWLEPDEWHGNARPEQLQLLSAHPAHRLHSQLNYTSLREQYAVAGREPITLNTLDAKARGIAGGDVVRVWNSRGQGTRRWPG
ncbi:hypothetical protein L1887_52704 [Cichorium endivia]|nr:hypothetical protein L1887_52704 [Cichorium endivia]